GGANSERLGGFEIDHQFKFGRLHNWQFGRIFAPENPAGVNAGQAVAVKNVRSVAHQTAMPGECLVSLFAFKPNPVTMPILARHLRGAMSALGQKRTTRCPLYPRKRTCAAQIKKMSAKGKNWTSPQYRHKLGCASCALH